MSFILEALKKSENARQRQSGPGFAGLPEKTQARKSVIWPWVIGALLLVNAVIIGVVLLRDGPAPAPTPSLPATAETVTTRPPPRPEPDREASPATRPPVTQRAPAVAAPADLAALPEPEIARQAPSAQSGGTEVRSLADEARSPNGATGSDTNVSAGSGPEDTVAGAPGVPQLLPESSPGPETEPPAQVPQPDLPDVQELYLSGELSGAPINLDLHVYFPESSRRVVFISGKRYREGEEIDAGLTVEEIIPAGVILGRRGRNYLLQAN